MRRAAILVSVLMGASVMACQTSGVAPVAAPTATTKLSKTQWVAESIAGAPVAQGSRVTLVFGEPGSLAGNGGCNRYLGKYAEAGSGLTFSGVGATKMACAPPLMDQETKYFSALEKARTYSMNDRGGLVIALSDGQTLVMRPDGS